MPKLQGDASPLLLPGGNSGKTCHTVQGGGRGNVLGSTGGLDVDLGELMPSEDVLRRSEFLEPVDEDTLELYREILEVSPSLKSG